MLLKKKITVLIISCMILTCCEDEQNNVRNDEIVGNWLYLRTITTFHDGSIDENVVDTSNVLNVFTYEQNNVLIDYLFHLNTQLSDSTIGTYDFDSDTLIERVYFPVTEAIVELRTLITIVNDTLIKENLEVETVQSNVSYLIRKPDSFVENYLYLLDE